MKEFFGFGTGEYPYGEPGHGYLSWQHLLFVSIFTLLAVGLSIFLGLRNKNKSEKEKNKVLIWTAFLIDGFEILKIIIGSIHDPNFWKISLPLFICSVQLITIPLAAFTKGKLKEACLDFIVIFGLVGGLGGTYGQALNFNLYPAYAWPNFVSAVTHNLSGFASLYIMISGMASLKNKTIPVTLGILIGVAIIAYTANVLIPYNYMHLMRSDGTPFIFFEQLVNGHPVLYPMCVMSLFILYILFFYFVAIKIKGKKAKN